MVDRRKLDPTETLAQRIHEQDGTLSWLRWDQLSDGSRAEYRAAARKQLGIIVTRRRVVTRS